MLVHRDLIEFSGDCIAKSSFSCPFRLLRTDCSQKCVSDDENVGQGRSQERAIAVNAAEGALRGPVLSRKNFLFAGADSGGERAAVLYTLLQTAKLNDLDPEAYLRFVLERIAVHPSNRLAELLPWHYAQMVKPDERHAA